MRTNYKRIKNIISKGYNGLEIIKSPYKGIVLIAGESLETEQRVRVELVEYSASRSQVGIHLKLSEDIEHDLIDAIETALKDMFPCIYIHQKPKLSEERKTRLLNSVQQWIDSIKKLGYRYGSMSLNRPFEQLEDTLNTMSEDQLEATLVLMSACYQKCGQESRDFRARMKSEESIFKAVSHE